MSSSCQSKVNNLQQFNCFSAVVLINSCQLFKRNYCNFSVDIYKRSILILPEENKSISIKIRRIRPRNGQGPTHALLPWFLCAYSKCPVWIDVYFLLMLFESLEEAGTPHSCALDLGISPLRLYLIQKKYLEFVSLPNVPALSWKSVWDWTVLSIVRLRHVWTGSLHSFRGRILLAGLVFES